MTLRRVANDPSTNHITIVGGGLLGTELASSLTRYAALTKKDFKVTQVTNEAGPLAKYLPGPLVDYVTDNLTSGTTSSYEWTILKLIEFIYICLILFYFRKISPPMTFNLI